MMATTPSASSTSISAVPIATDASDPDASNSRQERTCISQPETVSVALGRIHVEFFVQCLNSTIGRK